jgi:hypothetical protein
MQPEAVMSLDTLKKIAQTFSYLLHALGRTEVPGSRSVRASHIQVITEKIQIFSNVKRRRVVNSYRSFERT